MNIRFVLTKTYSWQKNAKLQMEPRRFCVDKLMDAVVNGPSAWTPHKIPIATLSNVRGMHRIDRGLVYGSIRESPYSPKSTILRLALKSAERFHQQSKTMEVWRYSSLANFPARSPHSESPLTPRMH